MAKQAPSVDPNQVPFQYLCGCLDKLLTLSKSEQKKNVLVKLWQRFPEQVNLFPLMRLLLPQLDTRTYGLKQAKIGDVYIRCLGLAPDTNEDARRLKNYRQGGKKGEDAGDFTAILYGLLKGRVPVSADQGVTVGEVNRILDELAAAEKNMSQWQRIFMGVLNKMTARQQYWLVKIILKDLKIGVGEDRMLQWFHPKAQELHGRIGNLAEVCELVTNRQALNARLAEKLVLFKPFSPMLCDRPKKLDQVLRPFKSDPIAIEPKYDGERIIIHKQGDTVKLFTR